MPELNRLRQLFAASLPQRRCCSADAGTESPPPRFSLSIALIRESPPLQSLLRQCYSTARKPFPELDMRLSKLKHTLTPTLCVNQQRLTVILNQTEVQGTHISTNTMPQSTEAYYYTKRVVGYPLIKKL
ncbi:hypothetical protein BUALT_Bualt16G0056000 [Buddleja alternifolia]|uniref:Uncharacterized protein n=1 Tax=Buddleja alternifolia TaxID=168488 RepID=A0AAV6WES1_9LAMI|nr:hypothetical protein BUALT_Bualt16G0056000 [Buddleja alternifolia]